MQMRTGVPRVNNPPIEVAADDWTWLLRVPVAPGQPVPLELWFLYHANTLMPMRALAPQPVNP